uniref:C2H2-type domain-containing protein n=1 Tax=viral metagenome TaxID=1070528 RepID=A0A6C0EF27_9ZZZZ
MEKVITEFKCKKCNKKYASYQSLWIHNKKFHTNINNTVENGTSKVAYGTKMVDNGTLLNTTTSSTKKNISINNNLIEKKKKCKFCERVFNDCSNKCKHEKICKKKINVLDSTIDKKFEVFTNKILEIIKKEAKIHPKTLQKINKNLINSNNTTNNSNNKIINIVKFGAENISEILEKKEIFKILNSRYKSLEERIRTVHFNKNRPEMRNIYITNLRDNIAHIYNGDKFEAVSKNSILNELINNHLENIEISFEDYKEKLPEKTCEVLEKFIKKIQDEDSEMIDEDNNRKFKNYREFKINEIKLMIYNEGGNMREVINVIYDKPKKIVTLKEIEGDDVND